MSRLLLLTNALAPSAEVLPALGLLPHQVTLAPCEPHAMVDLQPVDAILIDARRDLAHARSMCRIVRTAELGVPVLAIVTEGGLTALRHDWGVDDVVLDTAGPAEVDARLRLSAERLAISPEEDGTPGEIQAGDLVIDDASYSARVRGRVLHLTYREFELLKCLAQHAGRVLTRAQLLQEVWGYDYFGGTRTVDVHVRRLRAKLGPEHDSMIGTVRNVGYRFVAPPARSRARVDVGVRQ